MFWTIVALSIPVIGGLHLMPQALRSIKRGCSKGISIWLIVGWVLNNGLSLAYVIHIGDKPLAFKYALVLVTVAIIGFYKRID